MHRVCTHHIPIRRCTSLILILSLFFLVSPSLGTETGGGGPTDGWYRPRQATDRGVPVFIMMPLNAVTNDTEPQLVRWYDGRPIEWCLDQLKANGVHGVMADVWFGLVERDQPHQYRWQPYLDLCEILKGKGLKLQTVLSFHQCGGNVGDKCMIPLPRWILDIGNKNNDIFFKDTRGNVDTEYVSWGADEQPLFAGRTMLEVYRDFMQDFRRTFDRYFGDVIVQVQIGLGPAGELRYPSYQLQRWSFCGIGEFQCYDRYMLDRLRQAAERAGVPAWGHAPYPEDVGNYSSMPDESLFFRNDEGMWNTQYGTWFLSWYSQELIDHADRVLGVARSVFGDLPPVVTLAAKQAGVHWHVRSKSHAAELTAGYFNTRFRDGYVPIFRVFAKHNVTVVFTCMEMRDKNQPADCACSPEELVGAVVRAAVMAQVRFAGENAIAFYDTDSYRQISGVARSYQVTSGQPMEAFTYLRWTDPFQVFIQNNTQRTVLGSKFFAFVESMSVDRAAEPLYPAYPPRTPLPTPAVNGSGGGAQKAPSGGAAATGNATNTSSTATVPEGETGGHQPDVSK